MKLNEETKEIDLMDGSGPILWTRLIIGSCKASICDSVEQMTIVARLSNVISAFSKYMVSPNPDNRESLESSSQMALKSLDAINGIVGNSINKTRFENSGSRLETMKLEQRTNEQNRELIHLLDSVVNQYFLDDYNLDKKTRHKSRPTIIIGEFPMENLSENIRLGMNTIIPEMDETSYIGVTSAVKRAMYVRVADRLWYNAHLDAVKYYKLAAEIKILYMKIPYWDDAVRSIEQFTENNRVFSVSRGDDENKAYVVMRVLLPDHVVQETLLSTKEISMNVAAYCYAMVNYIMSLPEYAESGDTLSEDKSVEKEDTRQLTITTVTYVTRHIQIMLQKFDDSDPLPKLVKIEFMIDIIQMYMQMKHPDGCQQITADSRKNVFLQLINITKCYREEDLNFDGMMRDIEDFFNYADDGDIEYLSSLVSFELSEFAKVILGIDSVQMMRAAVSASLSNIFNMTNYIAVKMHIQAIDHEDDAKIVCDGFNDLLVKSVKFSVINCLKPVWDKIHTGFTNVIGNI